MLRGHERDDVSFADFAAPPNLGDSWLLDRAGFSQWAAADWTDDINRHYFLTLISMSSPDGAGAPETTFIVFQQ